MYDISALFTHCMNVVPRYYSITWIDKKYIYVYIYIPFFHFTNITTEKKNWQKRNKLVICAAKANKIICKFLLNANRLLLLLHLTNTVRCYLLLSQLTVQSRQIPVNGTLTCKRQLASYLPTWQLGDACYLILGE